MRLIFLLVFLVGCGSPPVNQNYVKRSVAEFSGGVFEKQSWKESFVFNRISWYRELSMIYDFFLTELKPENPFYKWLSPGEQDLAKKCQRFFIGMSYSRSRFNRSLISHRQLKNEMARSGFVDYPLIVFARHMRNHADFLRWTAGYYRINAFCLTDSSRKTIDISFPGFNTQTVSL